MTTEPRHLALEALYEADQRDLDVDDLDLSGRAGRLVAGVLEHLPELDAALERVADHWRVERMAVVDRAILRLGLYELINEPSTPTAVIVAEAVRLAKEYGTEKSGSFVNGVLATLADHVRDR